MGHPDARALPAAAAADFAAERAQPGDLVLVMGARDPSLTELARSILAAIETAPAPAK
jgi:hypothetical protein